MNLDEGSFRNISEKTFDVVKRYSLRNVSKKYDIKDVLGIMSS